MRSKKQLKKFVKGLTLYLVLFLLISIVTVENSNATAIYDGSINFDMNLTQIIVTDDSGQSPTIQFSSIDQANAYLGMMGINDGFGGTNFGGITIFDQYADAVSPDSANSGYSSGTSIASGTAINDFVQSGIFLNGWWTYASDFASLGLGSIEMIFSYNYNINVMATADSPAEYAMIDAWLLLETWDAFGPMPIVDALGAENTTLGSMPFWPDPETGSGTFSIILDGLNPFVDITMRADLFGEAQGSSVPEPSTFILFGLGCLFAAARSRKAKR